jgi:hypothetical protein
MLPGAMLALPMIAGSRVAAAEDDAAIAARPSGSESVAAPLEFNRDIRPILSNHCFKCHGPAVQEAELRLDGRDWATAELASGSTAIVPGDPAASALLERVSHADTDLRMPPSDAAPQLVAAQIESLRRWIAAGAEYQPHWSYIPPERSPAPEVRQSAWPRNPIDHFVLAELENVGLEPAGEAERTTLIRRVFLDLTGLPPSPDDVLAFVSDTAPDAYERLVDRLLASPQYGVRQALGWLDLARYADSDGYPHDGDRTVWPYRDWVVDAFNRDLPYDQFTIHQLAGDLLENATDDERVASAFHRQTRINREAGVDPEEFRLEAVIDRVNTTATVWLGATLGCAQCHDHKFDPLPQRDYYRLLAYFNNDAIETTTDEAGRISDVSPRMPWSSSDRIAERERLQGLLAAADDKANSEAERERLTTQLNALAPVQTLVMRTHEEPRATHVFLRGSFLSPRDRVTPGTLSCLETLPSPDGDDRLSLARWLVDKQNPLTARVAVNRLWAQYFGTGLVETLDDLGSQAPPCSHPALLDWLATEFMRHDWHWKPLHRLIVTSATYRQQSSATAEKLERDPDNRMLSRGARLRLPAELVRDNALAAAELLSLDLGGPSIASNKTSTSASGEVPYRRAIYLRWKRQTLDDMLASFDAPSRDVTCTRRTRTNTPLQALALLNERTFLDAARGLASRAQHQAESFDAQLDFACLAVVARLPEPAEREALTALYKRRRAAFAADSPAACALLGAPHEEINSADAADQAAWVLVANALLNLNEAITRE